MNPSPASPRKTLRSRLRNPHLSASTPTKLVFPLWVRRLFPRVGSLSTFVMAVSSERAARQAAEAYNYAIAAAAAAEMTAAIAAEDQRYRMKCKSRECHCARRDPRCKRRKTRWIHCDLTYANRLRRHAWGRGKHAFRNTKECRKVSGNWLWLLPHALSVLRPSHVCIDEIPRF